MNPTAEVAAMPWIRFAALCAVTAACASGGSAPAPGNGTVPIATPAPPPPKITARVPDDAARYSPGVVRYLVRSDTRIQQDNGMGMLPQPTLRLRMYIAAVITGPADTSGYPATFTIDSIVTDSANLLTQQMSLASARGLAYSGRLTARGEFKGGTASDTALAKSLGQLVNGFRNFYPRLPDGGAKPGQAWTDSTVTTDKNAGVTMTVHANTSYNADPAVEAYGGARGLHLSGSSTIVMSGSGDAQGQPVTIDGHGTETSSLHVSLDGRYLGGEVSDSIDLNIVLPQQGLTLPGRRVTHVTVQVLP